MNRFAGRLLVTGCLVAAAAFVAAPRSGAATVEGCPTPDATTFVVDAAHSKGGAGATCNYAVLQDQLAVGGFAVTIEFGCAADITAAWSVKPRNGATVTDTEILKTEVKGPGNFKVFSGDWSTQEKAFVRIGTTAIATIVAYSDAKIYAAKNLRGVADAAVSANQSAAPACARSGVPPTPSAAPVKKLAASISFGEPSVVQDMLDRVPVRVVVTSDGKAVPDAAVELREGGTAVGQGRTGADGASTIEYKVPNPAGSVFVVFEARVTKDGFKGAAATLKDTWTFNRLGTYLDIDPVPGHLKPDEPVTVTGRVYSAVQGFPLPHGVPSVVDVGGFQNSTDADGRFSVLILAQDTATTVTAKPKDTRRYGATTGTLKLDIGERATLGLTAATDRPWYPADGTIVVKGTLLVGGTPAQGGLVAARLLSVGGAPVGVPAATTGADGTFEFSFPSLSATPAAGREGYVLISVHARLSGAADADIQMRVRVRNPIDPCEPLAGYVAKGTASFPAAESTLLVGDIGERGRSFADGRIVAAPSGKVVLGFPLNADETAIAGVMLPAGARIQVLRYCRDESGRTTLVVQVLDASAVRVNVSSQGGPTTWRLQVVTANGNVTNVHTDYAVAVQGDTTTVSLHEGGVLLEPTGGAATAMDARRIAFMKAGSVHVEELPPDFVAGIDDPGPDAAAGRPDGPRPEPTAEPATVERFTIQAGVRRVRPNATVVVPVYLLQAERVANINVDVRFDDAIAAIDSGATVVQRGAFLEGALFAANTRAPGIVRIGVARQKGETGSGPIAWMRFVAKGAPGDSTALHLDVTTVNDEAGTHLDIATIEGRIEIIRPEDVVQGDCDGNGRLEAIDAVCALRMSVRLRPPDVAMDVDGSPGVTSRDATVILQRVLA